MSSKELLNQLSSMQLENCLTCPIDDLPHLDNSDTLNFIRRQKFQMKSSLNKLKNELSQKEVSEDTRSKIDDLLNLTLEQLRSLLEQKSLRFQFRNLDKLDEEALRDVLADYYTIQDIENKNDESKT